MTDKELSRSEQITKRIGESIKGQTWVVIGFLLLIIFVHVMIIMLCTLAMKSISPHSLIPYEKTFMKTFSI